MSYFCPTNLDPSPSLVSQGIPPQGLATVENEELKSFISYCICPDPNKRPEARQLLKHPFFDCIRQSAGGLASHKSGRYCFRQLQMW